MSPSARLTLPLPRHNRDVAARYRRSGCWSDQLLSQMIGRAAHDRPQRRAVRDDSGAWSYGELHAEVQRAAAGLRRLGVGPGDVVLWQAPNRREVVALFLACWQVGAIAVPVVELYRESEVRRIVEAVRPAAVVTVPEHRGFAHAELFDDVLSDEGVAAQKVLLGGARQGWTTWTEFDEGTGDGRPHDGSPDDPALILFTSGTTSAPKGAVHTSRSLIAELAQQARVWRWTWADLSYVATPMAHISGLVRAVLAPVWTGGSVLMRARWNTDQVADELAAHDVTFLGVPGIGSAGGLLGELLDSLETKPPLSGLRMTVASGPIEQYRRAEALGLAPGQHYGMSELSTVTTVHPDDPFERRVGTAGRVAFGVDIRVVDDAGHVRGPGQTGELQVRGPEQMNGYLSPTDDEAVWTADGWLRTGDVGRVDDEGYVTITGRLKEIINRGGEKFSVLEIEEHLATHPEVVEAAVVPAPDGRLGEVPAAFVVLRQGATSTDAGELARHLSAEGLARQKVPVEWTFIDVLPRTASGKVKKSELVSRFTPR